jgi:hypothetical protein
MPHEGRLSVCVTCRIHTDAAMLRGAISLSIFWKPIDGQRRGLTHFGLKPAGRDGSAVLDSVDTTNARPRRRKKPSRRPVLSMATTLRPALSGVVLTSKAARAGLGERSASARSWSPGDQRQVLSVPLGPSQL